MRIPIIKKCSRKNNKLKFYVEGFFKYLVPKSISQKRLPLIFSKISKFDIQCVNDRVNYCNRLAKVETFDNNGIELSKFKYVFGRGERGYPSSYFFDTYEYTRFFADNLKIFFDFGDVNYIEKIPSLVKSRPIYGDNENNVLLKLDKARHFMFVEDKYDFVKKKNKLIGRAAIYQSWRKEFYKRYFDNPLCDLGQVNKEGGGVSKWIVKPMSIDEHLKYKFILCLEGNDVATNLKWVMSSNSLAVMPKPKFETWFMEGQLKGDIHYVEIKNDYSNLEEKLTYYIEHPEAALQIVENAHRWVEQFKNRELEDLLSLLVLQKYFQQTGQLF